MPLKQNWTDRDTVTATFLNQLAGAVNSAVTSLAGKYTKPSGGIPASDLAGNVLTQPVADGRYAPHDYALRQLAANPDQIAVGTITRSTTGAATSFGVAWPDGATGTFTGTESTSFPGAIDGYTVTHVAGSPPVTTTYTQPTLTRDASGAVTARPAIVVS